MTALPLNDSTTSASAPLTKPLCLSKLRVSRSSNPGLANILRLDWEFGSGRKPFDRSSLDIPKHSRAASHTSEAPLLVQQSQTNGSFFPAAIRKHSLTASRKVMLVKCLPSKYSNKRSLVGCLRRMRFTKRRCAGSSDRYIVSRWI